MKPTLPIHLIILLLLLSACIHKPANNKTNPLNKVEINYIADNLNINEKTHFLQNNNPDIMNGISRFNIPDLIISDGRAQIPAVDSMIVFPAPINWAASWDSDLIAELGRQYAELCHANNISILRSPYLSNYRVPFSGSNFNCFGEDRYLSRIFADIYVNSLQSNHIAVALQGYITSHQEELADMNNIYIDNQTLHEIYLRPFVELFKTHPPALLHVNNQMINEQISSRNKSFLRDIPVEQYGFPGIIYAEASNVTGESISAGLHLNFGKPFIFSYDSLQNYFLENRISLSQINEIIHNNLEVMNALELYTGDFSGYKAPAVSAQFTLAENIADESIILLKNENRILPLDKNKVKKLAYVDLNDFKNAQSAGTETEYRSVTAGSVNEIREIASRHGIELEEVKIQPGFEELVQLSKYAAEVNIKYFDKANFLNEPLTEKQNGIIDYNIQRDLANIPDSLKQFRVVTETQIKPDTDGEYIFTLKSPFKSTVYLNNNILLFNEKSKQVKLNSEKFNLNKHKSYTLRIVQECNEAGNVQMAWYRDEEPDYENLLNRLSEYDGVFVTAGFNKFTEGSKNDRTFKLPENQQKLLEAIEQAKAKTIVAISSGGAVETQSWLSKCDALLYTLYLGEAGYASIGKTLFGENNPSGRLPFSIPVSWKDAPCYYSFDSSFVDLSLEEKTLLESKYDRLDTDYSEGIYVGYQHFDRNHIKPLFAFGFGLSYTTFKYDKLSLSRKIIENDNYLTIRFNITNTGNFDGKEVAQLYIQDVKSQIERPIKELKGFKKVFVKKGESTQVEFKLPAESLAFYHPDKNKWIVEPGEYLILIGCASDKILLTEKFSIQ